MATNLLLLSVLMASIITAAQSRSTTLHLNYGFHRQISAAFNGHEITLSQTGDSNGFNQTRHSAQDSASHASVPTGVGEGGFTTAATLVSSAEQQYIQAVVVVMILTLISSVTIVVLRTICNRYRSFGTDEENGPESTGTGSTGGPEWPNDVENETLLNGIESVGPKRPTYEPRPIPGTVLNNYELTIFRCNFPLCG